MKIEYKPSGEIVEVDAYSYKGQLLNLTDCKNIEHILIPLSLYKDITRILNEIPCKKVNGLINGRNSYDIVSALEKITQESDSLFLNYYNCPNCGYEWQDQWSCMSDDDCPICKSRNISPIQSEVIK